MKNRAQKVRLGIFVLVTGAILILLVGYFTTQQLLQNKDVYFVAYEGISVSGLEVGSPVKFLGIKVGSVQDIKIDPDDVNKVIVKMALEPGTPVKQDAWADITTVGITGLKTIEIRGGSNTSPTLQQGNYIEPGSSLTEDITGKAEIIANKAELVLNNLQRITQPNNMDKITHMIDSFAMMAGDISQVVNNTNHAILLIDSILNENRRDVRTTVATVQQVSDQMVATVSNLHHASEQVNRLVGSDTLKQILGSVREVAYELQESDIKDLVDRVARVANQTNNLLVKINQDLDRSGRDFTESMDLLRSTLENLNNASRMINQDPSVLLRGTKGARPADARLK